ncbi:MAG: hypothetical protein ACRDE2_16495, partial [Chitinophagaceae bacterium]
QLERIRELALDPAKKESEVKKERKQLFQYASKNLKIDWIEQLAQIGFQRAILFMKSVKQDRKEYMKNCRLDREKEVEKIVEKYGVDFCVTEEGITGLMLALYHGQNTLCHYFLKQKANINYITKEGMLPIHYLLQSFLKREFRKDVSLAGKETLLKYWYAVRPMSMTIQTQSQKFGLSGHSMLLFLLVFMRCTDEEVPSKIKIRFEDAEKAEITRSVFSMDMIMRFITRLPDEILPPYRKKRPYINSILAMHEVDREHPYNNQVFKRVDRGCYIVNPILQIVSPTQ